MDLLKSGATRLWARSIHYKPLKNYPKVNIEDVVLDKPRYGFRKQREPLLLTSVKDAVFPAEAIKKLYLDAGKPVPIKYKSNNDAIARRNYELYKELIAFGLPHFRVGEKKVYFPNARVCLLKPSANHTPYQAKFLVPKSFNKMDLRDYLWHVYGLRALNVTVALTPAKFTRGMSDLARYRVPQLKKMTVDMEEPFVWPEVPQELLDRGEKMKEGQMGIQQQLVAVGSDKIKPTDAFDGLYKKPELPNIFATKRVQRSKPSDPDVDEEEARVARERVANFLNL